MKVIEVKDQVRLSFAKCVELVLSGIKYRLFRAAITVTIVALAVAFLMTMLTESFVARRVADEIHKQLAPRRLFTFLASRMSSPLTERGLSEELATAAKGDQRWKEFAAWGSLTDEQLEGLADIARRQRRYLAFFSSLEEGQLRPLVGRYRGVSILEYLQDEQAFSKFQEEFYILGIQMHTDIPTFKRFLADWRASRPLRQAILSGNQAALAALKADLGDQEPKVLLAKADEGLLSALARHNFQVTAEQLKVISRQAALSLDADRLLRLLSIGIVKNRLSDRRNVDLADIDAPMFFSELGSARGARWMHDLVGELAESIVQLERQLPVLRAEVAELKEVRGRLMDAVDEAREKVNALKLANAGEDEIKSAEEALKLQEKKLTGLLEGEEGPDGKKITVGLAKKVDALKRASDNARMLFPAKAGIETFDLSAERIEEVADSRMREKRLARIEDAVRRATAGATSGPLGYSSRTIWLIAVSFMVCVVGIANAMLMSVTDRFREIATMKCLGATDGYIMINFILESCLQGTAGGVVGAVLGFLLGTLRSLTNYGWVAMQHLPVQLVMTTAAVSLVIGVMLSALAAVYPAWVAARLAPMEAMRIE